MTSFVRDPATNSVSGWEFKKLIDDIKALPGGPPLKEVLEKLGINWAEAIHVISAIEPHEALDIYVKRG